MFKFFLSIFIAIGNLFGIANPAVSPTPLPSPERVSISSKETPSTTPSQTPQRKAPNPAYLVSMKIKCNELGQQYNQNHPLDYSNGVAPLANEFTFSQKLNTCLMASGWVGSNIYLSVTDVLNGGDVLMFVGYTNESGNYVKRASTPDSIVSFQDYMSRKQALFRE